MEEKNISYIIDDRSAENKYISKIYQTHKYWSRKPWYPIRESIKKNSNEGDIVLDMFLGSGVSGLEAVNLNRNFIGFDLNPMSIFISENTISNNIDIIEFKNEIDSLIFDLNNFFTELYNSKTEKCNICKNSLQIQHLNIGPKFEEKTGYFFCAICGKSKTKTIRKVSQEDLKKINYKYDISTWIPNDEFPTKFYKDRFSYKGIKKVSDMYTKRNLYALSYLLNYIRSGKFKYKNLLLLAFSNTVLHGSKLKGENVRPLGVNNYWVPDDYFEENIWIRFKERINKILDSKKILLNRMINSTVGNAKLYNCSCLKTSLDNESVDYIINDPPYGDVIQYSELSFIWNSWMNFEFNNKEEIIINPKQDKKHFDFINLFDNSVLEANRILKKGKKYTLCFHNKEFKIWKDILDIFKKYNFNLEKIEIVDTVGSSYNKNWSKFSPKTDLYLTFIKGNYKPKKNTEFSLHSIIKKVKENYNEYNISKIYDILSVYLIDELYFNEYQIDITKLTIKNLNKLIEDIYDERN